MRPKAGSLRILVTDVHELAGLGALRSLGQAGHVVIAAYPQGMNRPASIWSRYRSFELCYPDPWRYHFEFRDWFSDQVRKGTLDAVLPVSEASIFGVAAIRKNVPRDILTIIPNDSALEFTLSKFRSTRMALALGLSCPETIFVSDGTPTWKRKDTLSGLHFPIVIKTDNYLTNEGVYIKGRLFFAKNAIEAARILFELEDCETRIIAQEMIPGGGVGACLLRFEGKTHLGFTHRRLHEVPYTGGYSSYRESVRDNDLLNLGESILAAIGYEGFAMVEFRRGSRDAKPYFIEINGRLWGSLALALHAGIDFPKVLLECYQNGCPSKNTIEYGAGIRCINLPGESEYLISILKAKPSEGMKLSKKLGAIIKSFLLMVNPMVRHDHFWLTDPLPGIMQVARTMTFLSAILIKKIVQKFQTGGEGLMLRRVYFRHKVLCRQSRYFQYSLKKILFVCEGNICRSPFAEHYWNARIKEHSLAGPKAISAGLSQKNGRKTPTWIADIVKDYSIDLDDHRSCKLTREMIDSADAIFIMHRNNYRDLLTQFPWAEPKIYYLGIFADNGQIEIDDPYNKEKDDARRCYEQLVCSVNGLIKRIIY